MTTDFSIKMERGDDIDRVFTVKDGSGVVIDISTWLLTLSAKEYFDDSAYVFQLSNTLAGGGSSEIEMTDPTNGEFEAHIASALTTSLSPIVLEYDIQRIVGGKKRTLFLSKIYVGYDVTI